MADKEDTDIIKRCQQGDEQAFQQLVKRYQDKAIWIAYQMVNNYEEARDISQDAFIRVYKSINKFNLMSNFYTWLYRIVVNLCIDHLRRFKNRNRAISTEDIGEICDEKPSHEVNLEKMELLQKIYNVLEQIPPKYKAILILRDIEDYDCKEVADILNCNHNTIRWRLFRGRQIFKDIWEKTEGSKSPV